MIDRIELTAELMVYAARLKGDGKLIQAAVVWRCISLINREFFGVADYDALTP